MTGSASGARVSRGAGWKGGRLVGAIVLSLMPALVSAGAAGAGATHRAAPAVACQTSWIAAGGGLWSDAGNWSSGVPTSTTNACITQKGTYTVDLTGIQNAAALNLGAKSGTQTLSIEGNCTDGSGELHLGASSTVGAHGTVVLTDVGDCEFSWLDQTSGTLSNAGTISVASSGTTQDRFLYGDVVNSGTIDIEAPLTSDDGGHTHTNTGAVAIANGAAWNENDAFSNLGGSLTTTGTGSFTEMGATFEQGNGATSGTVVVRDGGLAYTGTGASTIVTHGAVDLSGNIAAGQALTAEGTCAAGPAYVGVVAPWTNAGSLTLTDVGDCQYAWLDQTTGTFTNTGTIHVSNSGTTQARFIYGDLVNSGTITIDATLTSDDGGWTHINTGSVAIASGASWDETDSFWNLGGSVTTLGTGSFNQVAGTFVQGDGTTSGNIVVVNSALAYTGSGASVIVAQGTVGLSGNIAAGQALTVEGSCDAGNALVVVGAPLANAGAITLTDVGNCGYAWLDQSTGALTNTGTIHVANSGTTQNRLLSGTISNVGTLVLDAGTNLQTASGTLTNEPAGTIETHLASLTSFGRLTGTGAVQLDGTLSVVRDGTYLPKLGNGFAIVACNTCSGAFKSFTGQSVNGKTAFSITGNPTTVSLTVMNAADLSISGSAPSPVPAGATFLYTFVVQNVGPRQATDVVVTDSLPAGVTFSAASAGCTNTANRVTCTLGNIGTGLTRTVTVTVMAGPAGKVTNSAAVRGTTVDVTPANATSKVKITIT